MIKTLWRIAVAATALAITAATPAAAQNYPNKPIRVIIPGPAGGFPDVITRRIAIGASATMGQPWIIENRPGANFIPAAEACRHSKGDGYTLCVFTTSTLTFNPFLIDNLPYDPDRDFKPIVNLGAFVGGLVASPKLPVKTFEELRAYALANPGKLNFGTFGPASSANVFRRYLADRWGADIVEVAYKGSNELVAALVNNEIQLTWTALGNWADNPNDSKGKILTMDGSRRSPKIPNVPTYEETGIVGYPIITWMGLFAPAGTPDAIVAQVNEAVSKSINDPQTTAFLVDQMIEPRVTNADVFTKTIAKERQETGDILHKFKIPKLQ